MGHGHGHEVAHFKRCSNPEVCFCEVNRYVLAAFVGLVFATLELWIARSLAGSYGAESDAGHAYADSGFILISAVLAYWKHYDKKNLSAIDDLGTWINSLFLIVAGLYIFYRLLYGESSVAFAGTMMLAAGFVGLLGNYGQFVALGEKNLHETPDMHSTTRQHIFYDMLYSGSVMLAAAIVLVMGLKVNFLWQCLVVVILVFIVAYSILVLRIVDYEEWDNSKRIDYGLGTVVVAGLAAGLVINGSASDVDDLTAFLLALAMVTGGLYNIYGRYWKKKKDLHDHDHHGHTH